MRLWTIGIVAIGMIVWVVGSSQSFQSCINENKNQTSEQTFQKGPSNFVVALIRSANLGARCIGTFIDKNDAAITALATIIIAAFTGTLWRATTEQGRLTQQSIDLAREEFTASQRPKIIVRELLMLPFHAARASVEIRYVVANVGASEAEIVESWIEIQDIRDGILRPLQPTDGVNLIGKVIIEAGTHIFREQPSTVSLTYNALFFRGFIIYRDKNQIKRRTGFCRRYDVDARRFRIADDPDYEYAD